MNRIESQEISPGIYDELIYSKGAKNIQWRWDSLFNEWYWENWLAECRRMKLNHCLTLYTQNQLEMD